MPPRTTRRVSDAFSGKSGQRKQTVRRYRSRAKDSRAAGAVRDAAHTKGGCRMCIGPSNGHGWACTVSSGHAQIVNDYMATLSGQL